MKITAVIPAYNEQENVGELALRLTKSINDLQIDSDIYLNLAEDIVACLGDKEWARKIYKKAEGSVDGGRLADSIIQTLGDKKWAKLLDQKAKELEDDE